MFNLKADNLYDFINLDKHNTVSRKKIPNYYGNSWVRNFHNFSSKKKIKIFILVKQINGWNIKDRVVARGNNGGIIQQFSSKSFSSKIVSKFYCCYYKCISNKYDISN